MSKRATKLLRSQIPTVFVVGASGATGRHVVQLLSASNVNVRILVRDSSKLPLPLKSHERVTVYEGSILEIGDNELRSFVDGCSAIVSCLGHNLTLNGIFGEPRRLCYEATKRLCEAVQSTKSSASAQPACRFILMNTVGAQDLTNPDERVPCPQFLVVAMLRCMLPPHADNEQAAAYLRNTVGKNPAIEWCIVRPDGLVDEKEVSKYTITDSPTTDVIFDSLSVSRISVAHFMATLARGGPEWDKHKYKSPCITSTVSVKEHREKAAWFLRPTSLCVWVLLPCAVLWFLGIMQGFARR